ncbi:MAG: hypothetical protein ABFD54_04115 [Armatimonadota bacterium]|nr:hypothetical protein [bacterium]
MKEDRLRKDSDDIENLEDIIDAHSEHTSHIADDIDSFEHDIEIPEDIDVDDALTFPHPKHKKRAEDVELMDTPHKENSEQAWDWEDQDFQPTDYEHGYNEATDTRAMDDMDEVREAQLHDIGEVDPDDTSDEIPVEVMPDKFIPDEETEE